MNKFNNKKVIAFSLYGTKQMYQDGAIENSILVKKYYPDWECRFYVSEEIPQNTIQQLQSNGANIINKIRVDNIDGMFWRFLPMSEVNLDYLIVRDADSRILPREVEAVSAWKDSKNDFHIMRDHPGHVILIPGGMFGVKGGVIKNIEQLIENWKLKRKKQNLGWADEYGLDQLFLAQIIYPRIKDNVLIHTDLIKFSTEVVSSFPTIRIGNEFVGQVITQEEGVQDNPINLNQLNLKIYPNPKFYYDDKYIKLFNWIKKIRNMFKGKK
jgi:hypothetical protein